MNQSSRPGKSFEVLFSIILLAPILFFFFGTLLGNSLGFLFSLLSSLGLLLIFSENKFDLASLKAFFPRQDFETLLYLLCTFLLCLYFCLSWPDFISIGERLRDYALLASLKDAALQAKEPWMLDANLNYYLYWYRFAAFWSTILSVEVWQTYHLLAAFSFSFFCTCLFRLSRSYFGLPLLTSICFSLLIAFGSNIQGIINAFSADNNWWGPSRVITGTINEFPAWSFLLGDLHPHFLNLLMTPFILCLSFALSNSSFKLASKFFLVCLLYLACAPLYYNSNAWEVPMAGITFSLILFLILCPSLLKITKDLKNSLIELKSDLKDKRFISIVAVLIISIISLFLSSKNIQPADYPWRLVKEPVLDSSWRELMTHWGIPFSLIIVAVLNKTAGFNKASLCILFVFGISLSTGTPAISILILAALLLVIGLQQIYSKAEIENKIADSILFAMGVSSLILIALGELVYLDDPYGGENERMNTVFKIYSASWAPLHLFAFIFSYLEFSNKKARYLLILILLATLPAFFANSVKYRKNQSPSSEGLASVEQEFKGATEAIRYLRGLQRTVVLEAQGNAYSYTSFLSTLGGHTAYLGWANHVGLLTGRHEEVSRREKLTAEIYNLTDCQKKKELAKAEAIDLIVIGHLERQKYTAAGLNNFECLSVKFSRIGYTIVSVN